MMSESRNQQSNNWAGTKSGPDLAYDNYHGPQPGFFWLLLASKTLIFSFNSLVSFASW